MVGDGSSTGSSLAGFLVIFVVFWVFFFSLTKTKMVTIPRRRRRRKATVNPMIMLVVDALSVVVGVVG